MNGCRRYPFTGWAHFLIVSFKLRICDYEIARSPLFKCFDEAARASNMVQRCNFVRRNVRLVSVSTGIFQRSALIFHGFGFSNNRGATQGKGFSFLFWDISEVEYDKY